MRSLQQRVLVKIKEIIEEIIIYLLLTILLSINSSGDYLETKLMLRITSETERWVLEKRRKK